MNMNIPIILHVSIGTYRDGKIVDYSTHGHCPNSLILRPDEIQNHLDISPDNVVTIYSTVPTTGIKERKFEPAIQIRSGTGRSVKEVLQEALNPKSDQYTNLQPDDTIQVGDEIYGETDIGPIWYTAPHVLHGFHVNNSKIRRPTDMLRNPRLIKEYVELLAKIEATVEYLRHEVNRQPRPSEGGTLLKATIGRIDRLRLVAADLESATKLLTESTFEL